LIDRSLNYGRDIVGRFLEMSAPYQTVLDIGAGGGVGINTTSPENALHVNGAINLDPIAEPATPTSGFVIYVSGGFLLAKASTGTVTILAHD